jgi:hypothetical protein
MLLQFVLSLRVLKKKRWCHLGKWFRAEGTGLKDRAISEPG